jgi:hypothetical protein
LPHIEDTSTAVSVAIYATTPWKIQISKMMSKIGSRRKYMKDSTNQISSWKYSHRAFPHVLPRRLHQHIAGLALQS